MKALFTFLVIAATLTAAAQQITESDLLGQWKVTRIESMQMTIDYEKGEVTFAPEMVKSVPPEMLEDGKKQVLEETMIAEFSEGLMLTMLKQGERDEVSYTLSYEEGKTLMHQPHTVIELTLNGDLLYMKSTGADEEAMVSLKKIKE
jgi:hypothetical protein